MMIRPPLRDVAARAGVSEATVSRVLNGRAGVAPTTEATVHSALNELGFGDWARGQGAKHSVIGIVCGDLVNPIFPTMIHHLGQRLARKGFLTSISLTDVDLIPEPRCIAELTRSEVDGIVFIGGHHAEVGADLGRYEALISRRIPFVLVNGARTDLPVPHVYCDEEAGGRAATSHLVAMGHRAVGCITGPERFVPTVRLTDGYRSALAAAGIKPRPTWTARTAFTVEGGRAGAERLLDAGCTGFVCANDLMAIGASSAAASRGRRDVGIVGYDGTDLTGFSRPAFSTMRQPYEDMARLVVDAVVADINGSHEYRGHFEFEPTLLVRSAAPATT